MPKKSGTYNIFVWMETQIHSVCNVISPLYWYGKWEYSPQYTLMRHLKKRYSIHPFLGRYHMYSRAFVGFYDIERAVYNRDGRPTLDLPVEVGKIYAYRKYPKDTQNPTDPNDEWCEKSPKMLVAFHMRQREANFRNGRPTK